jgi:proline-specific peptidase
MLVFYRRHVCRVDPWPECTTRAFAKLLQNPEVYTTMWGPSEFCATGLLKEWDIVERLPDIRVPTLITSGRHDEVTPAVVETVHRGITGSQWVIFAESSHTAHVEETPRYLRVLEAFLDNVEATV